MHAAKRPFIPAAGYHFALRFYDPVTRLFGADAAREVILEYAQLRPGQRVLDLGCGTGTLALAAKRSCPEAEVTGLDPDEDALERARAKAQAAGVSLAFETGYADALPFEPNTFDRVLSSFMLHHLDESTQTRALAEVARVLKPAGSVHVLDFANANHGLHGLLQAMMHVTGRPAIHVARDLPTVLTRVGFGDVRTVPQPRVFLQDVAYYSATRNPA